MLTLKAIRDTLEHKGQFAALIVLVALGIMSYVTFQNGFYNLERSLQFAYSTLEYSDIIVRVDRMPRSAERRVETVPGVAAARVRTVEDVGLLLADGRQATARIVTFPDGGSTDVDDLHVEEGRLPSPAGVGELLLHPKFSVETGVGVNDRMTLRIGGERVDMRVVGVGTDPVSLYPLRAPGDLPSPGDFAIVYVTETEAERLFGRGGSGNEVAVRAEPGTDIDALVERLEDELAPYTVLSSSPRADQPGYAALQSELDQNRVLAQQMPVLVLVISAMSIFIALSRLVQSQRGEIGLAKALGYSDLQLLGHYFTFSLIIAAGGALLGVGLGLLGARGIAASYVATLGLPFLESGFYPQVAAVAVLLAVAACCLAAIVPAWASARLAPAIAMHADPNRSLAGGHTPIAERLLSPVLPRTFTFRVPLRNVFRARRRSLYTIFGIALAMVLFVVTSSMFDSIDYIFGRAFVDIERWDVLAVFESPAGAARVAEVRAIDGVSRVQTALILPVTLSSSGREQDVSLTAMRPDADFHGFTPVSDTVPADALAAGDLVISQSTAEQLGVAVGARVLVDSPLVDDPVPYRVGAISEEMLGQPAFVSLDAAADLVGEAITTFNAFYLTADPARGPRISDELYDMSGVASVQVKAGLVERLRALLELFNVFGGVLLAFGGTLAFVVIFTTFTANVTERTREIATMRTIGEDNVRLAVMVTIENLILALAALPLGIWLGVQATEAIFAQFETESYSLSAVIYPESVVRVSAIMIVVLLLSEIPPVRRIFRLDLAEATKVME
jgi:putative ABC transport system permease protein